MTPPVRSCKDCTDRTVGCHIDCERYKADTAANEAIKDAQRKESFLRNVQIERSIRIRAKRVRKKIKDRANKR